MQMNRISAADFRSMQSKPKKSKYRNVKTLYDGVLYDSKAEARFAAKLKIREQLGEIKDVQRQVVLAAIVNGTQVCTYKADFVYFDKAEQRKKYIDVKGFKTPMFKLKAKLINACLDITIECVRG